MFEWIADNASLFYLLFGLCALGLVAGWWMTRRRPYLLALIPFVVLMLVVWIITRTTETEPQRLQRIVEDMAQGVRDGDPKRVTQHFATNCTFRNHKGDAFRTYVTEHVGRGRAKDVTVSKFAFENVTRAKGTAKVEFWAHTEEAHGLPIRCEADFVIEGGKWKMSAFNFFQGNTRNEWPAP